MRRTIVLVVFCGVAACSAGDAPEGLFAPAPGSPIKVGGGPEDLAIGDVNGDRFPDLVVCGKGSTTVLLGDGMGGFRPAPGSPLDHRGTEMGLGDFNGDGRLDLALAHHDSYAVAVLLGDGMGGFAPAPGSPFAAKEGRRPHTHGLALTDLNGDRWPDLVTVNNDDNDVAVLLGDGRGGFARAAGSPFPVGPSPYPLAVGDVDGDGAADVVTPNSRPNDRRLTLLLGDGRGGFRPAPHAPVASVGHPYHAALGDVNGDRRLDLIATHDDDSRVTVLLGDGRGGFAPAPGSPFDLGRRPGGVVVADVNRDGRADLVAAAGKGVCVLLGDGRGAFAAAPGSPYAAGKGAWRLAVADLNGDGKPDVAAADFEGNGVTILLGR